MEPLQIGELEERRRHRIMGLLAFVAAVVVAAVAPFLLSGQNGMTTSIAGALGLGGVAVVSLSKSISPSRTWARRAFALLLFPLLCVPALSVWLSMRPLDANTPLAERELPGARISLPKWARHGTDDLDYWAGHVALRRSKQTADLMYVSWSATNFDPATAEKDDELIVKVIGAAFPAKEKPVKLGWNATTVDGQPGSHLVFRIEQDLYAAITQWGCEAGRTMMLMTFAKAPRETIEALEKRIVASTRCVKVTAQPKQQTPLFEVAGFTKSDVEGGVMYSTADESEGVFLSVAQPAKLATEVMTKPEARDAIMQPIADAMGAKRFRFESQTEKTGRTYWRYRGDIEKQDTRFTATFFACGERAYLGFHLTSDLSKPESGSTRLASARCP